MPVPPSMELDSIANRPVEVTPRHIPIGSRPRRLRPSIGRSLVAHSVVLAIAFGLYHLVLRGLMGAGWLRLGAVSYKLAPLYAYYHPRFKTGLLIAIGVLAAYLWFARQFVGSRRHGALWLPLVMGWFAALAVAVAGIDGNLGRLSRPFERTNLEYYGAVERVSDPGTFIRRYPYEALNMPMHAQTHPPGAVLFLWFVGHLAGKSALAAAWSTILFTTLTVPAVYLLARDIGGEAAARFSTALYALMPNVLLFTATSMDGPFAVVLIWSTYLGWRAMHRASLLLGYLAGLVLAAAAFMTFSASVVGLFLVGAGLLALSAGRAWGVTIMPLLAILAGGLSFYVPLYLVTGYHPVEMLGTAMAISASLMGQTGHVGVWQYAHIVVANLAAFFFASGLAVTALWGRQFASVWKHGGRELALTQFVAAFGITLLITDLLPLYCLETERVWMFLAPMLVIPAGHMLAQTGPFSERLRGFTAVGVLLALQTVLSETFLDTYW